MPTLINFKICDNAKECGGPPVCPTEAIYFDEEKETLVVDNDKCITCGACESECPVGAIMVASDDEEFKKLQKQVEEDKRTIKDLFVDRYGAAPLSDFFQIDDTMLEDKIKSNKITLIELYEENSIQCLIKSIPVKELVEEIDKDLLYYKLESTDEIKDKYGIKEFPSLLVFKSDKLLGKVEGYYETEGKEELKKQLNSFIK